jgi:hypothetical protein
VTKIINKFLDEYLGDKVVVKRITWNNRINYSLCSKNGITIVSFWVNKPNEFVVCRNVKLCNFISSWFDITEEDAMRKIRDWFGDKHNIKKFSDLNKFIKEYDTTRT